MSHLFISYAHADKVHLDKLVAWLTENDFAEQELWYDQHIEAGNNWRDEIATALDEAFVVLVIVTRQSMKSLYCTYEWAYAMGQGIPILPLAFDDLSIADIPSPLTTKQFTNCAESIPEYLKEQIRQLKSIPPQVAAINRLVYDTIYDTHRRFYILGWIGKDLTSIGYEFREEVLIYFVQKATEAHQILQTLMTEKSFAFSGKQYRHCWQLIDILHKISRLQYKYEEYLPDRLFSKFDSEWLPAFEYFEEDGWWHKWVRRYFEWDLQDEHNRIKVFTEIVRAFPIFDASDADLLISNKSIHQSKDKEP